jgi:mRNA interferase RelE/StbE
MSYKIEFADSVIKKDIPAIPIPYKEQIKKAIRERLTQEPLKLGKPLRYSFSGYRRLRIGDWRVIYKVVAHTVRIVKIGNRKEIYEESESSYHACIKNSV